MVAGGRAEQHEGELAALRQNERKEKALIRRHAKKAAQDEQDYKLQSHHDAHNDEDIFIVADYIVKVDGSSDGNEKQSQKQSLERFNVSNQFMPIFTVGEHHSCQKCTERGTQTDFRHENSDGDDNQEGGGGKKLP
jgi:hypothetical protein